MSWCKVFGHKWGTWGEPQAEMTTRPHSRHPFVDVIRQVFKQKRTCIRCSLLDIAYVVPRYVSQAE